MFVYIKCPQNKKRLQIKRGQYKKVPKQQNISFIKRGFVISQVKKRTNSPKYQLNILVKRTKKFEILVPFLVKLKRTNVPSVSTVGSAF